MYVPTCGPISDPTYCTVVGQQILSHMEHTIDRSNNNNHNSASAKSQKQREKLLITSNNGDTQWRETILCANK